MPASGLFFGFRGDFPHFLKASASEVFLGRFYPLKDLRSYGGYVWVYWG